MNHNPCQTLELLYIIQQKSAQSLHILCTGRKEQISIIHPVSKCFRFIQAQDCALVWKHRMSSPYLSLEEASESDTRQAAMVRAWIARAPVWLGARMAGVRSSQISYITDNSVGEKNNLYSTPQFHHQFPQPTPEALLAEFEGTPRIAIDAQTLGGKAGIWGWMKLTINSSPKKLSHQ